MMRPNGVSAPKSKAFTILYNEFKKLYANVIKNLQKSLDIIYYLW